MPLNKNSRMLSLMKVLNNTFLETKDECINCINKLCIESGICVFLMILFSFIFKTLSLVFPIIGYVSVLLYLLFVVIPYQFNIKEIEDAIYGDTFAIMEVNTELVLVWISKCNICLGRVRLLSDFYITYSVLFVLTSIYLIL